MKLFKKNKSKNKSDDKPADENIATNSYHGEAGNTKMKKKEEKHHKKSNKLKLKPKKKKITESNIENETAKIKSAKKKKKRLWPKKKKKVKDVENAKDTNSVHEETPLQVQNTRGNLNEHLNEQHSSPLKRNDQSRIQDVNEHKEKKKKTKFKFVKKKEKKLHVEVSDPAPQKQTVAELQNEVEELKTIITGNVDKLIEREHNLTDLSKQADELDQQTDVFRKTTRKIYVKEKSKNICCGICSCCPCCWRFCDSIREHCQRICGKKKKLDQNETNKIDLEKEHQNRIDSKLSKYGEEHNDDLSSTIAVLPQTNEQLKNGNREVEVEIQVDVSKV